MKFDFVSYYNKPTGTPQAAAGQSLIMPTGRDIAVIGTAGRDKSQPMTVALWYAMCQDLYGRVEPGDHLISGGAAWADHLAVHAYLQGWVHYLTLRLPAPLGPRGFEGPSRSAASAANYYHARFSDILGIDTLEQIRLVLGKPGVTYSEEFPMPGYGAMFSRNKKVAEECNAVIAYTFGPSEDIPADGGTLHTWRLIRSDDKVHVPLHSLMPSPRHAPRPA